MEAVRGWVWIFSGIAHCGKQTKSVYCIPKIGQGRSGFSFKDYCFDNWANTMDISAFSWFTPISIIGSDNPQDDQYACCR